jgi:regulator of sigma E protease
MSMSFLWYLTVIPLLGVLIFIHELGHFLVARLCGVGVEVFSLGFGKRLMGTRRGITDYRLSAIPLGGFVKMVGEDPNQAEELEDTTLSFTHKPVYQRAAIVLAGPVSNLLLAPVLFFFLLLSYGALLPDTTVGGVMKGKPAALAGIEKGDVVTAVNGKAVSNMLEMAALVQSESPRPLTLTIKRKDKTLDLTMTAQAETETDILGDPRTVYRVGIAGGAGEPVQVNYGLIGSARRAVGQTWELCSITIEILGRIFTGRLSAKEALGGPIRITQMAGKYAQSGIFDFFSLMGMLSVSLGLINLFPMPILDGGHLVFFLYEAVVRRPMALRAREISMQVGMMLLIMLMVYVIYIDILNTFFSG